MSDTTRILDDHALDILFREARTYNGWQKKDVSDVLLQALYDLLKWAPTSANCNPMRVVFVKSKAEKEKLNAYIADGNKEKTLAAPVTALIAYDMKFYDHLPKLFPHADARSWFAGNDAVILDAAIRNGTLQGGYLILAARALGLDCGPMSGFDKVGVKNAFFADQDIQVNFVCNLGYGDPTSLYPRNPRLTFDEACKIV